MGREPMEISSGYGVSLWGEAWRRLLRNRLAVFGLVMLCLIAVAVTVGPAVIKWITGFTPDYIPTDIAGGELVRSSAPSLRHPMGTDDAGRDILARVLQGGRISLAVGIISTLVSLVIGVLYGAVAGYVGGRADNLMMRVVDVVYSIPYILLVVVLLSVFGRENMPAWLKAITDGAIGSVNAVAGALGGGDILPQSSGIYQIFFLFFALGLVSWLTMARVVRGQVLTLKNQDFILAARATGVSTFGIIFRHIVPNALGPVIVYATLTVPSVMLSEAFLSFLGLGVQAPYASWGSLVADGVRNIAEFPWQVAFPGLTMALTLFSLNVVGDGLRDALDPQTRKF